MSDVKLAKELAKEIVREIRKEEQEKKKWEVFHNTKILMENYNDFKEHMEKAVSDVNGTLSEKIDITNLDSSELYILSIKRSKIKTMIMVSHIDMALLALKKKQENLYSIEKYKALEKYYLKGETYEQIAENLSCSIITSKRWVKEMLKELSIFLFGIEGLKIN